jgi:hypothetical protein
MLMVEIDKDLTELVIYIRLLVVHKKMCNPNCRLLPILFILMIKPDPYIEIQRYAIKMESVYTGTLLGYLNEQKNLFSHGSPSTLHTTVFRNIFCASFEDSMDNRPDLKFR